MCTYSQLYKGAYTGNVVERISLDNTLFSKTQYTAGNNEGGFHCHENSHISFVFEGGDIEKNKRESYERKPGDIFFYEAGEPHETIFRSQTSKNLNIEFESSFFSRHEISSNQIDVAINKNPDAKFLVLKILQELDLCYSNSHETIKFLILELCFLGKQCSINRPDWVRQLAEMLNDRWDEQISLEELSIALNVHPVTISKHFRKYFFCTYGEFMRKLKVERSVSLIRRSKMPLTEIAYSCGFSDQSHFTRSFKTFLGFLPKDLREMQ